MKKIVTVLILFSASLFANFADETYKKKCAFCHAMERSENPSLMKAPPMPLVSKRLKMVKNRKDFILFVNEYIQNPSKASGFCSQKAYERFGVMPAIGRGMSEQERVAVSEWLYDNFVSTGAGYKGNGEVKSCGTKGCCNSKGRK